MMRAGKNFSRFAGGGTSRLSRTDILPIVQVCSAAEAAGIQCLALEFWRTQLRIKLFSWAPPFYVLSNMRDALVMAFSTDSSTATMPVTYACLKEKVGVREESASMGALVGANDWFLDRCRTTINVLGDVNVSCLLDGRIRQTAAVTAALVLATDSPSAEA